jgi:cytoskeletal protein CcmA (bactofilin family)
MALVIDDRVKETSTTTGTGTLNLSGAVSGFQTFVAGIGDGNTTYYAIVNRDESEWETGVGTVTDATTDTLARTTVIASSNSDSAVDFSAGTKDVFTTLPASKAVYEDASSDVTLPNDLILGSDSAVLKFGADSDTTLTHTDGTGLTLNSTNKLLFRDSALYINSSTDGQLDLVADTEIQIAATTIDINGAVALDGAITGATNITLSGELDAATLDISGNADIDGTLEADAYTVDGTTLAEYIADTAGAMVSSNTETGITVTYQDGDNTIDFALSAAQTSLTSILNSSLVVGYGSSDANIDFSTDNAIIFDIDGTQQIKLTDGALVPITDNDIDLGTNSLEFKDAYFDGTVEADAITVGGTAVLTGGAETAITSVYNTSLAIGYGASHANIDFGTDNAIIFDIDGTQQIKLQDGALVPITDNDIDLGTNSLEFKNAYFDGTVEADAITIGGTAVTAGGASAGFALAMAVAL